MTDNICACHCGTRITIDDQLLEEREYWKEKYTCLQKQAANDIGKLKGNMYAECSTLMQQEFTRREHEQNEIINQKNTEIKDLSARMMNIEARNKVVEKEKEILTGKCRALEERLNDKEGQVNQMRSNGSRSQRQWEVRLEEELTALRKRLGQQHQQQMQALESQNQHLRHKVNEFDKKYQLIVPEVEKMKKALSAKTEQVQQLQARLDKAKREAGQQLLSLQQEHDQLERLHGKSKTTINRLTQKVDHLTSQLEGAQKVRKEVKVEPVYIEKPVEVEKVVEKIVEVEKIVNKYIEPEEFRDQALELECRKLKEDNTVLLQQLHILEQKYNESIKEYEECIKQYSDNEGKYKRERQELVKRIQQQERELDQIQIFISQRQQQSRTKTEQPQKITIHVNKEGKYTKTVERMNSPTAANTQRQTRVSKRR